MPRHSAQSLLDLIEQPFRIVGEPDGIEIVEASTPADGHENSIAFIGAGNEQRQRHVESTRAGVVLCDPDCEAFAVPVEGRIFVLLENPKLAFIRILRAAFVEPPSPGVHPSAVVHPEATISPSAHVGPLTYVGKASVGDRTVLRGNTFVYDKVTIGNDVVIEAGCVIGSEGVNTAVDASGERYQFPHLAGVVIEDGVEIEALNVIDRGILRDTVIGQGTRINSGCYIAHNSVIGEQTIILGHSMVCGSVQLGDDCWIGAGSTIRDRIEVGSQSFVGMGSLVVRSLEPGSRVMGGPARPVEQAKKLQGKLGELLNAE